MKELQVQMVEKRKDYTYKNTTGPTPATGITYEINSTQNDWQSKTTVDNGGGDNFCCCVISNLYFINMNTGLRCKGGQEFFVFKKQLTTV